GGEVYFNASYFFIAPFLLNHDRSACDPVVYHTTSRFDECTRELQAGMPEFREVASMSPAELATAIARDEIDILVDVGGHFPNNALRTFAIKPAPVQAAFPNYPATTGVKEIDYLFTDHWVDPPGLTEHHYVEQLVRIPSGYL